MLTRPGGRRAGALVTHFDLARRLFDSFTNKGEAYAIRNGLAQPLRSRFVAKTSGVRIPVFLTHDCSKPRQVLDSLSVIGVSFQSLQPNMV